VDESISILRAKVVGQKCSLHGFDLETGDPILQKMSQLLKASITNFLTNWYGLKVVPLGSKGANIIIINEANPVSISRLARITQGSQRHPPSILGLCSHLSSFDRSLTNTDAGKCNVGFVAKPVGPLKLARALMQCLEGAPPTTTTPSFDHSGSSREDSNDLSNIFEELSLSPHGGEVLDNSRMAADSDNARKAIESPTPNALLEKHAEFPFPFADDRPAVPMIQSMPADKEVLKLFSSATEQAPQRASLVLSNMESSYTSRQPSSSSDDPALPEPPFSIKPILKAPRLLLVDDNKINLTLLRTYMRKRKYDVVDEAENGFEAVKKVQEREEGYDIIFMDISMPVLDGFGATRQIRAIEEVRRKKVLEKNSADGNAVGEGVEAPVRTPALVIALTGLASSRDQSEAFTSGIDLFLTKPVAFKEVGKMLDNWEANREMDARGSGVSSGATSGVTSSGVTNVMANTIKDGSKGSGSEGR
jgi:CheY-like chemotaxis protein